MNIKDTQVEMVRNEIILDTLRQGDFPSVTIVNQLVDDYFKDRHAGFPRFSYRSIRNGAVSNSKDYNDMMQEIEFDLRVGFNNVRFLNTSIMSLFHYYESNRTKVDKLLQKAEFKSNLLLNEVDEANGVTFVGDNLHNFLSVDFIGDKKRNIPRTTAFVDLLTSCAKIEQIDGNTIIHDISDASMTFSSKNNEIIHLSAMENALKNTLDVGWRAIVESKNHTTTKAELIVEFKEAKVASMISIDAQVGKSIYCTLYVSLDGVDYQRLERQYIVSKYQWIMETREIKFLKFVIEKNEYDNENGSTYEYYFGAKNIQVLQMLFDEKGLFVSKPFLIEEKKAIRKIELSANHYIPPGTSIKYYVGLDYFDNVIEWHELSSTKDLSFNMSGAISYDITKNTEGYGDKVFEQFNSMYYRVGKLSHTPLKESLKIYLGKDMWLRETIPAPFKYNPSTEDADKLVYQTGVKDWLRAITARKSYLTINQGFDFLEVDTFHRYTTHIDTIEAESISASIKGSSQTSFVLFVNNEEVKGVHGHYTILFNKGSNKIEVYAYSRAINEELLLDFYIPNTNHKIFAYKDPLQQVSLYDLLNNTSSRIHQRFAIDSENNIIVNYNPMLMDAQTIHALKTNSTFLSNGMEYSLEYMHQITKRDVHHVRFMAILSKEDLTLNATPKFSEYKLKIE